MKLNMKSVMSPKSALLAALLLAATAGARQVSANVALEFNGSGTPVTYLPHLVIYSQTAPTLQVPDFTISSISGTSNAGKGAAVSQLTASAYSIVNTTGQAAELTFALSDTGFSGSGAASLAEAGSVTFLNGHAGDSVGMTSYLNTNNVQFGTANPLSASTVDFPIGGAANTTFQIGPASESVALGSSAAFALNSVVTLHLAAGSSVNLSFQTTAGPVTTPVPATVGLCGFGIIVLGLLALTCSGSKRFKRFEIPGSSAY